jgi:hypothetical protein
MYACRYGNYELLKIFKELGFIIDANNALSLLHLTCFSENMDIIKYLVSTVKLGGEGISSLLRISTVLNKREIGLYFFLNGGYIIDDTNPARGEHYYNIYPNTYDDKTVLMSTETNQIVPSNNIIKLSEPKKIIEVYQNYLKHGVRYKFDFVSKLVKKYKGRGILENKFDTVISFLNENPDIQTDVRDFL